MNWHISIILPSIALLSDAIRTKCCLIDSEKDYPKENRYNTNEESFTTEDLDAINKDIIHYDNLLLEWYSEFSTKFLSIGLAVMSASFAYCWYQLINEHLQNTPLRLILWIVLILSLIYIGNDMIRFYIISQSVRNIRKRTSHETHRNAVKNVAYMLNYTRERLDYFHDITWHCVIFQLVIFGIVILLMTIYLILQQLRLTNM